MKGKLFIAEDQPNFRKGLLKLAGKRSAEWVVSGEAANGRDALFMMEECVPDLLLTDIRMPHIDGLQLAEEIRSRGWLTKIVIVTGFKVEKHYSVQDVPLLQFAFANIAMEYLTMVSRRFSPFSLSGLYWRTGALPGQVHPTRGCKYSPIRSIII